MRISNININQSFSSNNNEHVRSFMGRVTEGISDAIGGVATAIDTTSKATESISEIAKSAGNVINSPEQATISVLTDQIDKKVVDNNNVPNCIRKTASYGSAALAAVGTFIAVRKAPRVIRNFTVNNLNKFSLGKKILSGYVITKRSAIRLMNLLGKERISGVIKSTEAFISNKTPKFIKTACDKVKLSKLKDWTTGDYTKNAVAAILGYQTGESILTKHKDKINGQNNEQKTVQTKPETDTGEDIDYSEAA